MATIKTAYTMEQTAALVEAFEAWWADTGEQSLFALNTTTDDDIKILAGIAWEAAIRAALAEPVQEHESREDIAAKEMFDGFSKAWAASARSLA